MAVTQKKLSLNQLTATAATQYTVPAVTVTRVTELLITNTDTVERTITVHFVPSGSSALATNQVLSAIPVPSKGTLVFTLDTVLDTGEFISALASAAAVVNLRCSGTELT